MLIKKLVFMVWFIIPVIAGCSVFSSAPVREVKGDDVVLMLYKNKRFKKGVISKLTEALAEKGSKIITGSVKQAQHYKASDYGAVVYMAEFWVWHTPWHAKKYYRNNKEAGNMVFVITSGDPNVVITKPFDAVTSASRPDKVGPVTQEILAKLEAILR